jgi:hypothetical protein
MKLVYVSVAGLEIIKVADAGNLQKERVLLRMGESASLINFVLINSNATDDSGQVIDLNDRVFWFPDTVVNQGDYVRLYSKAGDFSTQPGTYQGKPTTYHNFYWGLERSIWGGPSNAVVVFRVQNWVAHKVL